MPPRAEAVGLGNRPAGSIPEAILAALVVSVEQLAAALDRSAQAACEAAPAVATLSAPFTFNPRLTRPVVALARSLRLLAVAALAFNAVCKSDWLDNVPVMPPQTPPPEPPPGGVYCP